LDIVVMHKMANKLQTILSSRVEYTYYL
jgi:hypothetical protein